MNSSQVEVDSKAIIATVKPHPILYDRRIKSSIREKADKWAELGAKHGLSGHQMQTRWTSMRDKYTLYKRRAEAYPGTTLGKQLQLYKHTDDLTFLNDSIKPYSGLPPKNRCYNKYVARSKSWEKSHTLLVINQLPNFPLLFDKTHPHYNNCMQRMHAYRKIAEIVKRYNPTVTPEMVLKKIRNIRTQYTRARREQIKKQMSGEPDVPKLWFYNRLKFFDEKRTYNSSDFNVSGTEQILDKCNETFSQENVNYDDHYDKDADEEDYEEIDNVDEWMSSKDSTRPFEQVELSYADEETVEREGFEGEIEDVFDQKVTMEKIEPARNQKRNDLYVKCTSLLESLAKQIKPYETREKNPTNCKNCPPSTLLGKMIESELATVPEHIYIDAKWKIIRILEEAQKKSLQEKQDQVIF